MKLARRLLPSRNTVFSSKAAQWCWAPMMLIKCWSKLQLNLFWSGTRGKHKLKFFYRLTFNGLKSKNTFPVIILSFPSYTCTISSWIHNPIAFNVTRSNSALTVDLSDDGLMPCPKRKLQLQLRLHVDRICLFFNTGRRADLAIALAEVTVSNMAYARGLFVVS